MNGGGEDEEEDLFQLEIAIAMDRAGYGEEEVLEAYRVALEKVQGESYSLTRLHVQFRIRELESKGFHCKKGVKTKDIEEILGRDVLVIYRIPKPSSLFYVHSGENVFETTPAGPIVVFKELESDGEDNQRDYLLVNEWIYPLVPGVSVVCRSPWNNYVFMDDNKEKSVGLIFSDEVTEQEKMGLDLILSQLITLPELAHYDAYKTFSSQLSDGLVRGAEKVGIAMVKGSIALSVAMHKGSDIYRRKAQPESVPREVDPTVKKGLEFARWTSEKGVQLTGYCVSKVGAMTVSLGRRLAPHIQSQSLRALSNVREQSEEESQKQLEIVSDVVGGCVTAVTTVYSALENSTKILAKNTANNVVQVVAHKYGTDVGDATNDALSTAGNAYLTMYNAGALSVKGVANRTAKNMGKLAVNVPEDVVAGTSDPLAALDKPDKPREDLNK